MGQSITSAPSRIFQYNTNSQDASGFVVNGFNGSDVLLASVGLVNPPAGTTFSITTTRLGLQVKFVNAETGEYFTASGLGEASTVREMTLLNDENLSEVKFNQSTIGITTKKALETACSRIVSRMIRKKIFDH